MVTSFAFEGKFSGSFPHFSQAKCHGHWLLEIEILASGGELEIESLKVGWAFFRWLMLSKWGTILIELISLWKILVFSLPVRRSTNSLKPPTSLKPGWLRWFWNLVSWGRLRFSFDKMWCLSSFISREFHSSFASLYFRPIAHGWSLCKGIKHWVEGWVFGWFKRHLHWVEGWVSAGHQALASKEI